jgi:dihydrofolate reductase
MAKLIYIANTSVDGYTEGPDGDFQFTEPSDEAFALITDLLRPIGTQLYGRRMYETMVVWETEPEYAAASDLQADFARVWQSNDKVVYSTTLPDVLTQRTRIERTFDPDAVRLMKAEADSDLTIGGPTIAAAAFAHGLIDECHLFVAPVSIGGRNPALPQARIDMELLGVRRFDNGAVHLHYRIL